MRLSYVLQVIAGIFLVMGSDIANAIVWTVTNQWGSAYYTVAGDFNGDGRKDIASANAGSVYMKLSTGTGFTSVTWSATNAWGGNGWTFAGDFNGDGLADIASANGGTVYMKLSTGSGFTSTSWPVTNLWGSSGYVVVGDFNGDGRADIASPSAGNVYMKLSTGTGFTSVTWSATNAWGGNGWTVAGDFNADGLADIASVNGGNVYLKTSTGNGFTSSTWPVANSWGGTGWIFAADLNGDGRADIASPNATVAKIHRKWSVVGGGFESDDWSPDNNNYGGVGYTFAGDFNGNGITDFASADGGWVYMKLDGLTSDSPSGGPPGTYPPLPPSLVSGFLQSCTSNYTAVWYVSWLPSPSQTDFYQVWLYQPSLGINLPSGGRFQNTYGWVYVPDGSWTNVRVQACNSTSGCGFISPDHFYADNPC